jgi:serine/threonine protein kinase
MVKSPEGSLPHPKTNTSAIARYHGGASSSTHSLISRVGDASPATPLWDSRRSQERRTSGRDCGVVAGKDRDLVMQDSQEDPLSPNPGPTGPDAGDEFAIQSQPVPDSIGDYRVLSRVQASDANEIYLAQKMCPFGFVRRALVKVASRSRPDYQRIQRMLLDEARATALVDHPNLVALLDAGEYSEGLFLALEYVDGTDLARVNETLQRRGEALPFELASLVTIDVLRGLHHAHLAVDARGKSVRLVHRDVNPSNILISRHGQVRLGDFGVVHMNNRIQEATDPGLVKGKYSYLAPEYIAGEPCSAQTDLYAMGVVLCELLTGRPCFTGENAYRVMWKIVNRGVPLHRLTREAVPEDLIQIVKRATHRVPERRFGSAQEMANALESWMIRNRRHATSWVLATFLEQHKIFPDSKDTSSSREEPLELARSWARERSVEASDSDAPQTMRLPPRDILFSGQMEGESQESEPPTLDIVKQLFPTPAAALTNEFASEEPTWVARPTAQDPVVVEPSVNTVLPSIKEPTPRTETPKAAPRAPEPSEASMLSASESPPPKVPQLDRRQGSLENRGAVDILRKLRDQKLSGTVKFQCGLIWKKLFVRDGEPVEITSNMGMELIGEHLVNANIIPRSALNRALQEAQRHQIPLTEQLLKEGNVSLADIEREVGRNLETRLTEVLLWRWGTFAYEPSEVPFRTIRPQFDYEKVLRRAESQAAKDARSAETDAGADDKKKPRSNSSEPEGL